MNGKQSLLRSRRRPSITRAGRGIILGVGVLLLLSACDRVTSRQMTAEVDEPRFRRGKQSLASNQKSEAHRDFQSVIDKRQGEAPESHFEIGKIYLEHIRDYPAAIYHFSRYLELTGPNGTYAPMVNQMIETAKKEFARQLAGNPLEAQNDRLDLMDRIDRLTAENNTYRERLAQYERGGAGGRQTNPVTTTAAAQPPPSSQWTNAIPNQGAAPEVVPIVPRTADASATAASAPVDPSRRYVVERGDTLAGISRKFYGSPAHWRAIAEANRDRIPDPNALKVGTEIRLP